MYPNRKVGIKGQVVIPGELRQKVGLKPGSEVRFDYSKGRIIMFKEDSKAFWDDFFSGPKISLKGVDLKKLYAGELEERHNVLLGRKRVR